MPLTKQDEVYAESNWKFELSATDWTEIYNSLTDDDGVQAKLTEETTDNNDLHLTDVEWLEIYLAVKAKYGEVKSGFYGNDRTAKDWKEHMKDILTTLDPIRAKYLGGKAVA